MNTAVSSSDQDHGIMAKSGKKKATSRSDKAGLTWAVSKTHRKVLDKRVGGVKRVGAGAPVFIAAVVEYFAGEILELAGNICFHPKQQGGSRKRLTPQDVLQAMRTDAEINKATNGLKVLVGDKIKDATNEVTSKADKLAKEAAKEARAGA